MTSDIRGVCKSKVTTILNFDFQIFSSQAQRLGRMSKRLAEKAEEESEEEMKEDDGGHIEAASSLACDPSLTEVQAPSIPSSKFCTACMYYTLLIHM